MSSSNFLEKYTTPSLRTVRPQGRAEPEAALIDEQGEDFGCFGYLRGVKERAVMLELHKKTGNIRAIPYAWIESIDYDPSDGLTLRCSVSLIRIKGRNLHHIGPTADTSAVSLFGALCRQRVPWIRESGKPEVVGADVAITLIDQIDW